MQSAVQKAPSLPLYILTHTIFFHSKRNQKLPKANTTPTACCGSKKTYQQWKKDHKILLLFIVHFITPYWPTTNICLHHFITRKHPPQKKQKQFFSGKKHFVWKDPYASFTCLYYGCYIIKKPFPFEKGLPKIPGQNAVDFLALNIELLHGAIIFLCKTPALVVHFAWVH